MQIVDTIRDYYDYAGAGIDTDIRLDRRQMQPGVFDHAFGLPPGLHLWMRAKDWSPLSVDISPFFALVGGHAIPGVRISIEGEQDTYAYNAHTLTTAVAHLERQVRRHYQEREIRHHTTALVRFLAQGPRDKTAESIQHRWIAGLLVRDGHKEKTTFLPALLHDIGLADVVPPHEAHMLVARFVGGILTDNPPIAELSDRDKIVKAGFDTKQSFRTRPA